MSAPLLRRYLLCAVLVFTCGPVCGQEIAVVPGVERQPLVAATQRLIQALQFSGAPLAPELQQKLLQETQTDATRQIRNRRLDEKPYWHIERCRVGDTRTVPVEVIVNGNVAVTETLVADGRMQSFDIPIRIEQSSWVAVRILPSAHTNPIFVHVADQPIRVSKRSAEWCADAVRTCWESKKGQIREEERAEAHKAYRKAEAIYEAIAAEIP